MDKQELTTSMKLVRQVVTQQGVRFIKEFLRAHREEGVSIGTTKAEVTGNLKDAVREGKISLEQLEQWIRDVEGWGDQHIYLYHLTPAAVDHKRWSAAYLKKSKPAKLFAWSDHVDLSFPKTLKPARMFYDGTQFEMVWQRAFIGRIRAAEMDKKREKIEGDWYQFCAHREVPARSIVRFVANPSKRVAAISIQLPLGAEHNEAIKLVRDTVGQIIPPDDMKPVDLSKVIKALDSKSLKSEGGMFTSMRAKFARGNVTIDFEAPSTMSPWDSTPVREVRTAMDTRQFEGHSGRFGTLLDSRKSKRNRIQMSLDRRHRRIYFQARMTAQEVWSVLLELKSKG